MNNPLVCCILLTADRPRQFKRALRCFETQTEAHRLFVLDSGTDQAWPDHYREVLSRVEHHRYCGKKQTIGELRNIANDLAIRKFSPDVLMHMDDDDWSAPTRLAEQVAHLQQSGADVVGYSDMLFWDSRQQRQGGWTQVTPGEAWLFNNGKPNYALGTSMMYWRRVWERKPFPDVSKGCDDYLWVQGLKVASVSSIPIKRNVIGPGQEQTECDEPRMVAEIHGGNTCASITEPSTDWQRVPAWDARLADIMRLA